MSVHNYRERRVANKYAVTSAATKQRQGPATPKLLPESLVDLVKII